MKRKLMLLLTCLFVGIGLVTAQSQKVTGIVVSGDDGQPVIGASILVKGTTLGTTSDIDGKFVLNVPASGKTLVVSYIGMVKSEFAIKPNMRIELKSNAQVTDEVVVVAYGTQKKSSFTGSAEIIKADKINNRAVANVSKALDGMIAGVQTTSGSGQPGAGSSVVIRGFGSINASTNPLYVVDGVPYDGNISSINPSDIESMTVLKDASAGALYGSRGANGVIMITTNRGNSGKLKVDLKASWGVSSRSLPRYETMDERSYLETVFQSYKNSRITNGSSLQDAGKLALQDMATGSKMILGKNQEYNPFNYPITDLIDPLTGKVRADANLKYSENWVDEATKKNPLRQEYVLGFSGGSDKTKYAFTLGYLNEEGLLKTTSFKRYSGRMNIDSDVNQWLKVGISSNYSRNESNSAVEGGSGGSNVWYSGMMMAPIFPVYAKDASGNTLKDIAGNNAFDYGINRSGGASPNWNCIATLYDDKYASSSDNLSGRMHADLGGLKTGSLKGLKFSVSYGFDMINNAGMTYYNPYNGNAKGINGSLSKLNSRTLSYTFNQILYYDRSFGDHHFDVLGGHEYYKYNYNYLSAGKTGFPFGGLYQLNAATTVDSASSYENNYTIESLFSRLNYDYKGKYYLSGSFRTDGSSRFYKDYRWGTFWSVGGNWRISEESFLKDVKWLNNLSLKASYGIQGNDNVGSYYAWQSFYSLSKPNASMSGGAVSSLENKNLKWEKNANLNIGVEFKVFDRVSATLEFYSRKTSDMLLDYPMASSLGFDSYSKNVGSMRNTGIDATIAVDLIKSGDLRWRTTLMGSTIKNKVLALADKPQIITGAYIIKEGETLNSFYTATSAGVDPATGSLLYWAWNKDAQGNRVGDKFTTSNSSLATGCKEIQGSRIPDFYGSIGNDFKYKNFDFGFLCTYSVGGKILDSVYSSLKYGDFVGQARSSHLERAWKQVGDITDIPKIEFGKGYITTNDYLINASYFAFKNVTLGYTIPSKMIKGLGLGAVRFSATGDNLCMFTHLKGLNPQYNFSGSTDYGYVPTRTISLAVNVKF